MARRGAYFCTRKKCATESRSKKRREREGGGGRNNLILSGFQKVLLGMRHTWSRAEDKGGDRRRLDALSSHVWLAMSEGDSISETETKVKKGEGENPSSQTRVQGRPAPTKTLKYRNKSLECGRERFFISSTHLRAVSLFKRQESQAPCCCCATGCGALLEGVVCLVAAGLAA